MPRSLVSIKLIISSISAEFAISFFISSNALDLGKSERKYLRYAFLMFVSASGVKPLLLRPIELIPPYRNGSPAAKMNGGTS